MELLTGHSLSGLLSLHVGHRDRSGPRRRCRCGWASWRGSRVPGPSRDASPTAGRGGLGADGSLGSLQTMASLCLSCILCVTVLLRHLSQVLIRVTLSDGAEAAVGQRGPKAPGAKSCARSPPDFCPRRSEAPPSRGATLWGPDSGRCREDVHREGRLALERWWAVSQGFIAGGPTCPFPTGLSRPPGRSTSRVWEEASQPRAGRGRAGLCQDSCVVPGAPCARIPGEGPENRTDNPL